MKKFTKPENLNGAELIVELATKGVIVKEVYDFSDGTIGFETDKEVAAGAVVAAHNGNTLAPEATIEDKLASVGLNVTDLKSALGL